MIGFHQKQKQTIKQQLSMTQRHFTGVVQLAADESKTTKSSKHCLPLMASYHVIFYTLLVSFALNSLLVEAELARAHTKDYYYTRTRQDPNHLRISEEFKNSYVKEIKHETEINGTKYEFYKSSLSMSYDELVFETIDKIFRHRLSAFYLHHYDNQEDKKLSSDPRIVSNEACARDLLYLVDKLPKRYQQRDPYTNHDEDHLSPELTAFFDSYARQEPGLLMGNIYWVGSYDQCINRHIFELTSSQPPDARRPDKRDHDERVISFKGRYCVAALKSPIWDSLISSKKVNSKDYFKTQKQINEYSNLFRLQVGVCLPSSCDSSSFERHPAEMKILTTSMLDQRFSDYEMIDLYCLPDESSPLRSWSGSALAFLVFITIWTIMLVVATLADFLETFETPDVTSARGQKPKIVQKLIQWLSLRANYRKVMKVTEEHVAEVKSKNAKPESAATKSRHETLDESNHFKINLRFLNAFKALVMFWIVNGHIMLLMIQTAKNILNSDALLNPLMHFLIGGTFGVDLFFTMTGFLTAYLLFNSGHALRLKPGTVLYLTFHRYWRLAPIYLISFWFSRSVMQLLGSGPLWDYGTSSLTFRGLCNTESWLYPLTLTSNLHGLFEECMITSWYISCDMQFWLVSPIFIYLLAKSPGAGWAASLATIATSSKMRYDAILSDKSARYDELVQPRADIFMRVSHDLPALYTQPQYRISTYLVGLLAGHYVYMIKSGKWSAPWLTAGCERVGLGLYEEAKTKVVQPNGEPPHIESQASPDKKKKSRRTFFQTRGRQLVAYTGLVAFLTMTFVCYLFANYFPVAHLNNAKMVAALAYSVDHLVMGIGASLIIVAMCFGQWSDIVTFLSYPFWTRVSKLNYALLLLQCEAIYYQVFRYDQVPLAGTKELINILFNLLVTLYPLAFAVTLAFEFPLANLEKLLLPAARARA